MSSTEPLPRGHRHPVDSGILPVGAPPPRSRRSDQVLDQLLSAIRTLALVPGQSLSETDLAEQLHVSRTPLREALARLADNGLVTVVPQVGTRVSVIRMTEVIQSQFVRETLEVGAFTAACAYEARDVTRMRELLHEQQAASDARDFERFFVLDEALHEQVFVLSGYPGAWAAVQGMKIQLERLRRLMPDPQTLGALITEHTAIVDALETGDVQAGAGHIATHTRRVLTYAPSLRARFPDYFAD